MSVMLISRPISFVCWLSVELVCLRTSLPAAAVVGGQFPFGHSISVGLASPRSIGHV